MENRGSLRHRLDRLVKIARLIPGEGNLIVNLRGFAADMDHRPIGHPLLVVDFDGIVANRQDQVRSIGECFHVGAPRPTDNAGPVLMAFRQKTLCVERRNEGNFLSFNELKQLSCVLTAGKGQPGDK